MEIRSIEHLSDELPFIEQSLGSKGEALQEYLSQYGDALSVLGAYEDTLKGILAYRNDSYHVALFLVKQEEHHEEVEDALFEVYRQQLEDLHIAHITALATKDTLALYKRLGFDVVGKEVNLEGVSYTPMEYALDKAYLGKEVTVIVDRPYGSLHPHYPDTIYTCNYGYVDELVGGDGEFQDAYIYGIEEPIDSFKGIVIGIVYRKNDYESKWIVAKDTNFNKDDVIQSIGFIEQYFETRIVWLH